MQLPRFVTGAMLGVMLAAGTSHAQVADSTTASGSTGTVRLPTFLRLGATASVQVAPDVLVGELVAEATARSAATAQRQVNALIETGTKDAHAVAGVEARAMGYSVAPADPHNTSWTARQTLELRGADGASLLDLAGRLQERGFAAASLDWQLSDAAWRKAHDTATIEALKHVQQRARDAAAALGLRVDHLQSVQLDSNPFGIPSAPAPMVMMRANRPQATPAPEEVTADVSAEVTLGPR